MLLLVTAVLAYAPPGAAASEESAETLVERGLSLRRARDDQAALRVFEQAYELRQSPMILAQIALAEQALGRFLAAEQHLTESLASADPWVEQRRPALETALGVVQSRLGWLEVRTSAEGAELWLDEEPRPLSSSPFRLLAGTHRLLLKTKAGGTIGRTVVLRGGERQVYHLELAVPPAVKAPTAPTKTRARLPASPVTKPAPAAPGHAARTGAYVAASIAGVALIQAVAASILRQHYVDDYNGPSCAPNRSERCPAYRSSANAFGTFALVGYALAGAAGVTSLTLFTEPWWSRPDAPGTSAIVGVRGAF